MQFVLKLYHNCEHLDVLDVDLTQYTQEAQLSQRDRAMHYVS